MTIPNRFNFIHTNDETAVRRSVEYKPEMDSYYEAPAGEYEVERWWPAKEVHRFIETDKLWVDVRPELYEGEFKIEGDGDDDTYTGKIVGDMYHVTWPGCHDGARYYLSEAADWFSRGKESGWYVPDPATAVAAPVPSLIEQLVSVAAAAFYDLTFEPDGYVQIQRCGSRSVRLKSDELALQWFGLKAQLDALENAQ